MDSLTADDIESRLDDIEVKLNNQTRVSGFADFSSSSSQLASGNYLVTFVGQELIIRNIFDEMFVRMGIDGRVLSNVSQEIFSYNQVALKGITSGIALTDQTPAALIYIVN